MERIRQLVIALRHRDDGNAVIEYSLVILVAGTVGVLLLNWAQGGAVTGFFDQIFARVTSMFSDGT